MNDMRKTKRQLIQELEEWKKKADRLEASLSEGTNAPFDPHHLEQPYRAFFDHSVEGFFQSIPEGRFLRVNPAFARMLGYSSPEELLSSIDDLSSQYYVKPEDRKRYLEIMNEHEYVRDYEYKARRKDGSEIWVSVNARTVRNDDGRIEQFEGHVQDITARKTADETISRYRFMVEHAGNEIYLVRRDGSLAYANRSAAANLGYSVDELASLNIRDFDPLYGSEFLSRFEDLKTADLPPFETVHVARDGHTTIKEFKSSYLQVGEDEYVCSYGLDITERKTAEDALRKSEAMYRSVIENIQEVYYRTNREGLLVLTSPSGAAMFGYERVEDILGTDVQSLWEDPGERPRLLAEVVKHGSVKDYVGAMKRRDGRVFMASLSVHFYRDDKGNTLGTEGIIRDVTELKKAEAALRKSEETFRKAFHTSPDAVNINRLSDGMFVSINDGFTKATGYTEEDVIGKTSSEIDLWVNLEDRDRLVKTMIEHSEVQNLEAPFRKKNGSIDIGLMSASIIDIDGVAHILSVTRDITDRKKAEEAVRISEKRFRDLAELLPQAVFETDVQGRFTYVNRFALELYGYTREEFQQGINAADTVAPRDREKATLNMVRVMGQEMESGREYLAIRKDGEEFPVVIYSTPVQRDGKTIGLRGIVIDLTERKRLESQLTQAQKLEAVGTLAGGMAHNFNNILMGIQGHVSMMLMKMTAGHPHYERLKSIEEQILSGADLTKQLLGFARGGKYEVKPLNINVVLARTAEMFAKTKREITIDLDLGKDPMIVRADRSQMEQMLMNLLVNAWQAMPAGGNIYLETKRIYLNTSEIAPYEVAPGPYARITVQDTGTGMDERTRQRIFEPFFTTKQMGRGTGLGLATVYGIVKGHKGYITVYSEPGHGTKFNIYLPTADAGNTAERETERTDMVKGSGVVLLVEDEEQVLETTCEMLEFLGYTVITAQNGQEAIDAYRRKGQTIDLILMDMIMPGISGSEAIDALVAIDPSVRIVLASGYSLNGLAGEIMDRGCRAFIQKPYNMNELSRTIADVIRSDVRESP
ncbi:MAG: PAS domain S-box protein [Syntrophaceae bacterium]|nr:PAS domain S-box protein [Syntrophaceae bacterium]